MSFPRRILVIALCAVALVPVTAAAQDAPPAKLVTGTWTGVVTPPDGSVDVTYEVSYKGDTLSIVMTAGPHGKFPLNAVEHTATKLSFTFTPGPTVVCALKPNAEGGYAGDCTDDGGLAVPMTMVPPAKDAKAPESGR
jgi:hypothetical protein